MAYARYSPISDVYVYLNMDNLYVCQNCPLINTHNTTYDSVHHDFLTTTPQQMINHLLHHHITLKHRIPNYTMYHLQQEYKP